MAVGRNDPCPCGSGKKYKKCCLDAVEKPPESLAWNRIHQARQQLFQKLMVFSHQTYGEGVLSEAWEDFRFWRKDPFDPDSPENQIFFPWFLYEWTPDPESTPIPDKNHNGLPPAIEFLIAQDQKVTTLEREYIRECLKRPFSFFEITGCEPGHGFSARCVFTLEELEVVEKKGSGQVGMGDILFAKPVTAQGVTTFEAMSHFAIPPIQKLDFVNLRKELSGNNRKMSMRKLEECSWDILDAYHDLREFLFHASPPVLANTDGDPINEQTSHYEISSAQSAFDSLKGLAFEHSDQDLLEHASFDPKGSLKKVEFPWLKKAKAPKAGKTVLARIFIEGNTLRAEVNSDQRAAALAKVVKKKLGKKARFISTTLHTEPVPGPTDLMHHPDSENLSGANDPEIERHLAEAMEQHWANWIHEKVPALGNKTPLHAAKTKAGRELLNSLLTQFERNILDHPQAGVSVQTFRRIRERLGMKR